jgi:hypothetical protein
MIKEGRGQQNKGCPSARQANGDSLTSMHGPERASKGRDDIASSCFRRPDARTGGDEDGETARWTHYTYRSIAARDRGTVREILWWCHCR